MLGLEIPPSPSLADLDSLISEEVDYLIQKWMVCLVHENSIDPDETLYLFTWSPNPDEMPDADFNTQHRYNINLISHYLQTMEIGLACVESSQMGNPHYHGWYQLSTDPLKEKLRLALVKTLQRFGNLKITKSKGHYKIGSLVKQANCLYYYKKDMLQSMATVFCNPITAESMDDLDWNLHKSLFTPKKGRISVADIEDKISQVEFYKQFYQDSL